MTTFFIHQISNKIAELLSQNSLKSELKIIYQSTENLHKSCPSHLGDWYFTGNYPTPAGTAVANRAFIQYCDGIDGRPYDLGL